MPACTHSHTRAAPPDHVNRLLRCNFSVLRLLGDRVMRPFLKDTLQLGPLAAMMAGMLLRCLPTALAMLAGRPLQCRHHNALPVRPGD